MKNGLIKWDHQEIPYDEIRVRIDAVQKRMRIENLDALIAFGDVNEAGAVNYFSNFAPYYFSAALIIAQTGDGLMTTDMAQRGKPWILANSLTKDIRFERNYGKGCSDVLKEIDLSHNRVGIVEFDLFPYIAYLDLTKQFHNVEFIDVTEMVNDLRMIRSSVEINIIRKAAEIADEAIKGVLNNWNFRKECELAAEIERQTRYRRCEDIFVHVASHEDGIRWLHLPTEQKLEKEIIVEMMVQYKNYWADLGRTILPKNAEPSLLHLKDSAEQIYLKAIKNIKPGAAVNDIFQAVKGEVNNDNLKVFSSIGFGLYVESMQRAWINDENQRNFNVELRENMEIVFQLGFLDKTNYNKWLIQDTFLIGKKGFQNLTETPFILVYY
jgi:Xaa-Pro aminopeptidase